MSARTTTPAGGIRRQITLAAVFCLAAQICAQGPTQRSVFRELRAATRLLADGRFVDAEAVTVQLLDELPESSVAWYQLALARSLQPNRRDDALAAARRAVNIDETFVDARLLAANLLLPRDPKAARHHALEAGRTAGEDLPTLREAIRICLASEDIPACRELIQRAHTLAPQDADLLTLQAEVALAQGHVVPALAFYREVATLRPRDSAPRESLARLLLAMDKEQEAVDTFISCLDCDPTDVPLREELIALMQRLRRPEAEISKQETYLGYYRRLRAKLSASGADLGPKRTTPSTQPNERLPVDESTPTIRQEATPDAGPPTPPRDGGR